MKTVKLLFLFSLVLMSMNVAQALSYEKTSTVEYSVSNVQLADTLFNATDVSCINVSVTPLYTETGPYDVPTSGLVGWWKFDGDANDSSGNNLNGTVGGNVTYVDGKYNNAAQFNSNVSYIQPSANQLLYVENGTGATWSWMVNPYPNSVAQNFLCNYGVTLKPYINSHTNTFNIDFVTTTGTIYWSGIAPIETNQWFMATVVYRNSTAVPTLSLYLNGLNTSTRELTAPLKPHTGVVRIVGYTSSSFNGAVDNALLYNRSLTDEEIAQIYYDNVQELRFKTNSNNTYSSMVNGSGSVGVPCGVGDATISSTLASLPSSVEINGVTVRNYTQTVSPFSLTSIYQYTGAEVVSSTPIVFTTSGATFAPSINVTGTPEILWTFADGSTSTATSPSVDYGTSGSRNTTLTVAPWSAVTQINLGFDGEDGGSEWNGNAIVLKPSQNVTAISGLDSISTSLIQFAASHNDIAGLDFSDFTSLNVVECYYAGLENISLFNTPSLERLCVEGCYLESIDLSGCANLLDIRVASQHNQLKEIIWMADPIKCYHVCCRANPALQTRIPFERFTNLTELYSYDANQSGDFRLVPTANMSLLWDGSVDTTCSSKAVFDISGAVDAGADATVYLYGRNYSDLDVSDCADINNLRAQNNSFSAAVIDKILQDMYNNGVTYGENPRYLYLYGNAAPSAAGIKAACGILDMAEAAGETCDLRIDAPDSTLVMNEHIRVLPGGSTANSTGSYALEDLYAIARSNPDTLLGSEDIFFDPSNEINVTVKQWSPDVKVWNESSDVSSTTTTHIIKGLPANAVMQITRDGEDYATVQSNGAGVAVWTYSGGYSEHEFTMFAASEIAVMKTNANSIWSDGIAIMLVVVIVILAMVIVGLLQGKKIPAANISDLAIGLMAVSLVVIVGYGVLSVMNGII